MKLYKELMEELYNIIGESWIDSLRVNKDNTHIQFGIPKIAKAEHEKLSNKTTFSQDQLREINKYTQHSFDLNTQLLANYHFGLPTPHTVNFDNSDEKTHNIDILDSAVDRPIGRSLTVYSGMGYDPRKVIKGNILHNPTYISTSHNKQVSNMYASNNGEMRHMLRIELKPYDYGAYIGHVRNKIKTPYDEHEFLLPRNTIMRIHRSVVDKDDPTLMIHHATIEHTNDMDIKGHPENILDLHKHFIKSLIKSKSTYPEIRSFIKANLAKIK